MAAAFASSATELDSRKSGDNSLFLSLSGCVDQSVFGKNAICTLSSSVSAPLRRGRAMTFRNRFRKYISQILA